LGLANEALRRLNLRAPTDEVAFALVHMRTERGVRLDFTQAPYLSAILRDRRPTHCTIACAQSRKTVTYVSKLFHLLRHPADDTPRTAIYTFPTVAKAQEFSKARLKRMIQASPLLHEDVADVDAVGVKTGRSGWALYLDGTFSELGATSTPADILVHDELNRSDPATLQVYASRLRASHDPRRWLFSTPSVPRFGVSALWEETDQNEWVWQCGQCGREQTFAPMDRHVTWRDGLDLQAETFRCCHCAAPVDRARVLSGRWVPQKPENAHAAGYHITAIMPPESTAPRLAKAFGEAIQPEVFAQEQVGIDEVSGTQHVTAEMIRFGEWANALSADRPLVGGLDPGGKHDFIAGDGKGKVLAVHRLGDWGAVANAMSSLRISVLVCDGAYDPSKAQELARQFSGRVFLADYSLETVGRRFWEHVHNQRRVRVHRTAGLDYCGRRIIQGGDGGDVFPALPYEQERELKAHLTNMARTSVDDAKGRPRPVWQKIGPDHLRHAHLYYTVASEMTEIGFGG